MLEITQKLNFAKNSLGIANILECTGNLLDRHPLPAALIHSRTAQDKSRKERDETQTRKKRKCKINWDSSHRLKEQRQMRQRMNGK